MAARLLHAPPPLAAHRFTRRSEKCWKMGGSGSTSSRLLLLLIWRLSFVATEAAVEMCLLAVLSRRNGQIGGYRWVSVWRCWGCWLCGRCRVGAAAGGQICGVQRATVNLWQLKTALLWLMEWTTLMGWGDEGKSQGEGRQICSELWRKSWWGKGRRCSGRGRRKWRWVFCWGLLVKGELQQGKKKGELAERESLLAEGRRKAGSRFVREERPRGGGSWTKEKGC